MRVAKVTHVGLVRKSNEDALIIDENLGLFGVADGMGGHKAGEVASELAVQQLVEYFGRQQASEISLADQLREGVSLANEAVYNQAMHRENLRGMGTTITVGVFRGPRLYIANVGDSRAYLLREGVFTRLTTDHSLVFELVQQGGISQEEAFQHPQRNVLTRALGTSPEVEADITEMDLMAGDLLLFCTDGLCGLLREEEIAAILKNNDIFAAQKGLLEAALERGGQDNISMVLVELD
ncbi:MAG TPA: Stp1/IreP family PP2C-type Ser/Thr phosphatase [Bacillota bacterium]|nr:Stp1/IreP family PP2C-type Ser/Thr phosphatase [Bacillota bacterium]